MAFGIKKEELARWKEQINQGEIAFLTHYWLDDRFPESKSVTKVGCADLEKLAAWGRQYGLQKEWIHQREEGYSHFDLMGQKQLEILQSENIPYKLK